MDFTVTITDAQLDQLAQKLADKLLDVAPGLAFPDESGAPASPSTRVSSIPSTAASIDTPGQADPAAEYRANLAQLNAQAAAQLNAQPAPAPAPAAPVAQDVQGTAATQGAEMTPAQVAQAAADQFAAQRQGLDDDQGDQAPKGPAVFDAQAGRFVHADELTHPELPASPAPTPEEYTAP